MLCLLWDFGGQTLQLLLRPLDLAVNLGALVGIEGNRSADQAPIFPARDRHHCLQIPQQLGDQGCGWIR
jgi:hypothetical protein